MSVLQLFEPAQYLSKSSLSDHGVAGSLLKVHRDLIARPGVYGEIEIEHLSEDTLRRYISVALREFRYLTAQLELTVRENMFPKMRCGEPHLLGACVVCSEGCDPAKPLPVAANPGEQRETLAFTETVTSRSGKVRRCCPYDLGAHHANASRCDLNWKPELQNSSSNSMGSCNSMGTPCLSTDTCWCCVRDSACMQSHIDGNMKMVHFASAGKRDNALALDDTLPTGIFVKDRVRDQEDAQIAADLDIDASTCPKTCNNFKADKITSQCASVML